MEPMAGTPYEIVLLVIELVLFFFVFWFVIKSATKTKAQMALLTENNEYLRRLVELQERDTKQ
ncbi:hypothetical protein ACGVWS_12000 [Enterobacteriaceae bacterium LUAb1]